jgi:hypothetical protein
MWLQSGYYLITGLWPLVYMPGFLLVSGWKTDVWLVRTVGVLILCVSIALVAELRAMQVSSAATCLSVSSAIGLLIIDVYYRLTGVIGPAYLADAAVQLLLLLLWGAYAYRRNHRFWR